MIDLHHGDAFEGLAGLADSSVGVTITDPPFDKRTHRAAVEGGHAAVRCISLALPFAAFDANQIDAAAKQIVRVTRRWIVVFVAERQQELWTNALEVHGARFVRYGQAIRTNPRPQMSGDRPAPGADTIVIAHRVGIEKQRWNGGGKAGVWKSPAARFDTNRRGVHPAQKSIALMKSLVADFTEPGELVCDPFAGSATTGVACTELARRFVGWERDAQFYAIGLQRLRGAQSQQRLAV